MAAAGHDAIRRQERAGRNFDPLSVATADDCSFVTLVYPFLFEAASASLQLDWEHDEYRWIDPAELDSSDCVPWIRDVWLALHLS